MAFKIGDLFVKLGLQKGDFDKGLDDAKNKTNAFGGAMKKIGGLVAGVFAADKIIQFGKEVFNIATQAEGVQTAFNKIANIQDLNILRDSVRGTVSDLELMKRAVTASNFGIPVRELGRLFEFAAKRSQDTGQSVDYLVDSIVTGIGRKSPLILDNLGISAIQLKEKLKGVGLETASVAEITKAVGDIAEESFAKTGKLADTLGTKVQNLSASWENLKLTISGLFSNSETLKQDLDDWSKLIRIWQSKEVTAWEKFLSSVSGIQANKVFNKMKLNESVASWINQKEEESTGAPWEKPKADPIVKTAKEQLDAIKKVNEELEAQRILRQEFKGQKLNLAQVRYKEAGDFQLGLSSFETMGIFGNLDSSYKSVSEKRKKWTEEELQGWTNFTEELNQTISSGMADAISSLTEGLAELAVGNITGKDFGNQVLSVIGGFMKTLGSLMIAYAINMALFAESAKNPLTWPVALAAGVAMVAAGTAISGFANKGLSGSSASASTASGYKNYSQSNAVAALTGNVVFELEGTKLKGVLNNTDRRNNLIR